MACVGVASATEWEFVREVASRTTARQCVGPRLMLTFHTVTVRAMEDGWRSEPASDLLWEGFHLDDGTGVLAFTLCAGHWCDLMLLLGIRGQQCDRPDLIDRGVMLLTGICEEAGWDPREISNMLVWQRRQLT